MKLNIIIGLIISVAIAAIWLSGYKHGKKQAEAVFSVAEMKTQKANSELLRKVNDENTRAAALHQQTFAKAIENRDNELADLRSSLDSSKRLYITTKSRQCSDSTMPTKAENSSKHNSAGRAELSENDSRALWGIAEKAQEVVIKYNALADICRPLVEVVE